MIFRPTAVAGAWLVEPEPVLDRRGFFARVWCQREFREHGLAAHLAQCSMSHNTHRGTLRGLHYQAAPFRETKLVRCTSGAIYDVALDLRAGSPSFLRHVAVELTAENCLALYVPAGVAHGFQTLEDDTDVLYQMSAFHEPTAARGVRYDDPSFAISWPVPDPIVIERDRSYPDFSGRPA